MRNWKIVDCGIGVVAGGAVACLLVRRSARLVGETAGAATPARHVAMPVPVTRSSRRRCRSIWNIRRARKRSATSRCRRRSRATCSQQHVADGADVKEGDLLYTIDPRDYQAALDQAKAQVQRDDGGARLCALQSRPRHDAGQERLSSPRTASTSAPAPCGRREAALAMRQAPPSRRPSSISAYTEIRAPFAGRLGRNQASGRHAGQRRRHGAQHAGAARSDLRHLQSERDGSRRRSRRRGRSGKVEAEVSLPGETRAAPQGRAHLHRQCGRPRDRHDHGARHHRQCRSQLAARPICPRPAACQASSPTR